MRHLSGFIALAVWAGSALAADYPDVKVHLQADESVSAPLMDRALLIAKSMFRDIGVEVVWSSSRANTQPVKADVHPVEISLRIVGESNGLGQPDALAYAQPYGAGVRSITVMYDRIAPIVDAWPALGPTLLAHVMSHEIAHVLEESDGHSPTGVMKAHWTRDDYWQMSLKPLSFTPSDVALIRQGAGAI